MKGPWRALFYQGSPEICLRVHFGVRFRVHEGPWKDQGWSVTLWELTLVSLESLDMLFVA